MQQENWLSRVYTAFELNFVITTRFTELRRNYFGEAIRDSCTAKLNLVCSSVLVLNPTGRPDIINEFAQRSQFYVMTNFTTYFGIYGYCQVLVLIKILKKIIHIITKQIKMLAISLTGTKSISKV